MAKGLTNKLQFTLLATILFFLVTGCAAMNKNSTADTGATAASQENEPYFPTSFGDFEVPGELRLERKKPFLLKLHHLMAAPSIFPAGLMLAPSPIFL